MARYALVIGIAKYDKFTNLPKAVNDAQKIAQLLSQQGRFDVQPLPGKLIENENYWQVTADKKLTGKELGQTLRTFLLEKAKGGEGLIYFAGHGFEAPSLTGEAKGYLATSDGNKEDGQNAIAFDDLNALIAKSQLSSLVVLLDCCYAGSLLERSFIRSSFSIFNNKQDYCLISASRSFERAREDAEGGIFTRAVLAGLAEKQADEATGEINVNDLISFVTRQLKGSGQEAIYMGGGRSIPLVWYPPQKPIAVGMGSEECPYRGLEAFDKEHAKLFFGRQKVVNDIQQKLGQANFIPIIGASGSGKSSVVRAGLIPVLEHNNWRILEPILPGNDPLAELKRAFVKLFDRAEIPEITALIDNGDLSAVISRLPGVENVLLVVDQFEEVFTLCSKEEERYRFIELLTQVVETFDKISVYNLRLAIITTMRADFLEPCLNYASLTKLIQKQAVYMPPLLGAELERAIISPANLQGYNLEIGLLGAIQQEIAGQEKGCLPLLQFALTELWKQRNQQTRMLTVAKYNELGGVIGALNHHAEKLYASFTLQQQDLAKLIFLKLLRTGADEKDTRQRQSKTKLLSIAGKNLIDKQAISYVLEKLIQGRLLVADTEATAEIWVDLAHEALMLGWERFADWRQQGRELRRLCDRIEDALEIWQQESRDENLIMGGLLAQVRDKWLELEIYLDEAAKKFYFNSIALEAQQRQQYEDEATNRTKSRFLANVSHELRTPLNAIIGFSRLLQEDAADIGLNKDLAGYLEVINDSGIHLLDLINDILDLSKVESGRMVFNPKTFEIITLINNVILQVKPSIEKNRNIFEINCNPQIGTMFADEMRVQQILLNLLSNAAKFTTNGKVTLSVNNEITESQLEPPSEMINFHVKDTGVGISLDEQQKLFQAFHQFSNSSDKKYNGIGLGLAVSYKLCQVMGGNICIESQPGVGSTFTLTLPRN